MAIRTRNTLRADGQTCVANFRPRPEDRSPVLPALSPHVLNMLIGEVATREMHALHFLADNADIITVDGVEWLLSPAPTELVDILAEVGANVTDLEIECEDEGAQCDDEGCYETDQGAAEDEQAFGSASCTVR